MYWLFSNCSIVWPILWIAKNRHPALCTYYIICNPPTSFPSFCFPRFNCIIWPLIWNSLVNIKQFQSTCTYIMKTNKTQSEVQWETNRILLLGGSWIYLYNQELFINNATIFDDIYPYVCRYYTILWYIHMNADITHSEYR